jgi:hypothetical protein
MDETSEPRAAPSPRRPSAGRERGWHLLAVSTGSLVPPIGLGVLHPVAGEVFAGVELAVLLVITGTALFGSQVLSERAFRLLRWLGNRPEPPAPPSVMETAKLASVPGRADPMAAGLRALVRLSFRP